MARVMWCSIAMLSVAVLASATPLEVQPDEKPINRIKEWKGSFLKQEEEPLIKEAPKSGYVIDQKAWSKLWKAWRGKQELPKIDFENQLVLVGTWECGANTMELALKLDDEGNLKGDVGGSKLEGPGFVYMMVLIERSGVKTYNGKLIKKD